jgi:hypothetical protein
VCSAIVADNRSALAPFAAIERGMFRFFALQAAHSSAHGPGGLFRDTL